MGNKISKLDGMQERYSLIKLSFVAEQYYQQYTKERQNPMDMENDNTLSVIYAIDMKMNWQLSKPSPFFLTKF